MEIEISEKLKYYLSHKKIDSVTIYPVELKHSDFNPKLPTVLTGKPKDLDKFASVDIDNITFYVDKSLYKDTNVINLKVRRFLFIKEIYVDGWDLTV